MKKDRSQTRKKQTGQGSNSRKRPDTKAPPPLSVVDARARQKIPARLESHRLAPMSAVGMLVMTLLTAGFIMAERTGLIAISLNYKAGINAFSLRGLLLGGLIPLVTASLLIVIYRPTAEFILGTRPDRVSCFLAPVTGLLMGWLVWGGVEFVRSWSPRAADWIAIPKLWEISGLYLGRSPLYSALVMIVAVVIPATSGELAFRGLVLPSYMGQRRRMGSVVLPALFSAFIMLDVS
ncbi:MAG TPA: hypothetical protein VFD19_01325, partial [Clostridia bacterium]|nr:hypothetical protein [Clostridia bacterium]